MVTVLILGCGLALSVVGNRVREVRIPDPELEWALRTRAGKPGRPLTPADLATITELDFNQSVSGGVQDLTGLEHCPNLQTLSLSYHSGPSPLSLEPLRECKELVELTVRGIDIASIEPLAHHGSLEELYLQSADLVDASPLSSCPALRLVDLRTNALTNADFLGSLPLAEKVDLSENQIRTIPPLSRLTHLSELRLNDNPIESLAFLAECPQLTWLELGGTAITDWGALSNLKNLKSLALYLTSVDSLAPVADLPHLSYLDARGLKLTTLRDLHGFHTDQLYIMFDGTPMPWWDLDPAQIPPGAIRYINAPSCEIPEARQPEIEAGLATVGITITF